MTSFKSILQHILDFLLPPLCLGCDQAVTRNQSLCASCWHDINFIAEPCCDQCGVPFDFEIEGEALCGQCHAETPHYTAARSVFVYNDASKGIVLKLKHADQLHPMPALAQWMGRAGYSFWAEADMIIPVPLHRWRLLKRRYNQSAILAQAIGEQKGVRVVVDGLMRNRSTPPQGHFGRKQRQKNVRGAFAVNPKFDVVGRNIVLIDDVMTSGATVNECARLLKKEGALRVNVLTLARVT